MKAIFLVILLVVLKPGTRVTAIDSLPDAINSFGFQLYRELAKSNPNLFFSGYSVATGLNMLLAGARNNSEKELMDLLGYNEAGISKSLSQELYRSILMKQRASHNGYVLNILNSIAVPSGVTLLPEYEDIIFDVFLQAEPQMSFGSQNATVSLGTATTDNLKFFNAAKDSNSLLLVSVALFNGTWKNKFNESLTIDHPFNNGSSIKAIPFMNTENIFAYYENEVAQVLELPYAEADTSMIIILPKNVSLPELEKGANLTNFKIFLKNLRPTRVTVKIPKFASSSNLKLEDVLKGLGMKNSFTSDADFTGIDGHKGLFVSNTIQVADINVTENKIVSITVGDTMVKRDPRLLPVVRRATFKADQPFAYVVYHRPTDIILLMGRKTVA